MNAHKEVSINGNKVAYTLQMPTAEHLPGYTYLGESSLIWDRGNKQILDVVVHCYLRRTDWVAVLEHLRAIHGAKVKMMDDYHPGSGVTRSLWKTKYAEEAETVKRQMDLLQYQEYKI